MTSTLDSPGRYGTIQLLRQNPAAGVSEVVTSFGVDTQSVSFGRGTTCSVRLYYPDVAPVHARIVFNDARKAFLEICGAAGLSVDGCTVYPHVASPTSATKTIALGNGSEIVIHGKRFRFVYPPKERRAALAASPARPANRALRLSMIASAQVFSPRPSPDPRQNLRVLQSPLRLPAFSPSPSGSPPSPSPSPAPRTAPAAGDDDDTITLVQGAHPRVVEEARDLVILEDVEVPLSPSPGDARGRSATTTVSASTQPKTPRRQSLHRAVLIRSAQRAVWAANTAPAPTRVDGNTNTNANLNAGPRLQGWSAPQEDRDNEPDEDDAETDTEEEEAEVRGLRLEVVSVSSGSESESDASDEEEGPDNDEHEHEHEQRQAPRLGWRKSLERLALWPFGGRVKTEEEETTLPAGDDDEERDAEHETPDEDAAERDAPEMTPPRAQEQEVKTPSPRKRVQMPMRPQVYGTPPPQDKQSEAEAEKTPIRSQQTSGRTPARPTSPQKETTRTPFRVQPQTPAGSTSPQKAAPLPFGAPHPAARTPAGFGRRPLAADVCPPLLPSSSVFEADVFCRRRKRRSARSPRTCRWTWTHPSTTPTARSSPTRPCTRTWRRTGATHKPPPKPARPRGRGSAPSTTTPLPSATTRRRSLPHPSARSQPS
ncbi:hypothetical protein B0H15DRAFT_869691 [Mycena belliarum]|uniref:FHA domain-containing protein n=1 Tax=Mycena belliarum TaxID=1033014 RepID=A0AAD6TPU9_9AGAR|nr:hypothetical protein B0H15DRAFT_869691 [Mycena belliae]